MTRETCATCRFHVPSHVPDKFAGKCFRHPPYSTGWPNVFPNNWCGEHQPVAPAPAASDEYARAAVRWSEAAIADMDGHSERTGAEYAEARREFFRLYRERENRNA